MDLWHLQNYIEGVKNTLSKMPVRTTATKLPLDNKGDEGRAAWDYDKWQKEDPKGLENMYKNNRESFDSLLNKFLETKNIK
jgi:hypothetical protein